VSVLALVARVLAQDYSLVPIGEADGRVAYFYPEADLLLALVRIAPEESDPANVALLRRSAIVQAQRDVVRAAAVLSGELRPRIQGRIGQGMIVREERSPAGGYLLIYVARRSSVEVWYCSTCASTQVVEGGLTW
jgi:hypothetical protein